MSVITACATHFSEQKPGFAYPPCACPKLTFAADRLCTDGPLSVFTTVQEQAIAIWEQAQGERAAGRVPSIANFQTLLSAAQAQREGPTTPEPAGEASVRADSGLRRCAAWISAIQSCQHETGIAGGFPA